MQFQKKNDGVKVLFLKDGHLLIIELFLKFSVKYSLPPELLIQFSKRDKKVIIELIMKYYFMFFYLVK